jgi:hypothetical protein
MSPHHAAIARILIGCFLVLTTRLADAEAAPPAAWSDLLPSEDPFSGWTVFHEGGALRQEVWSVSEDGVLSCKGSPLGYLATIAKYGDFELKLQYRWRPGTEPGKGGVLIRKSGVDKIWPKSLEAQINAGGAGDFWGLDGYALQGPPDRYKSLEHPQFGRLTNVRATRDLERPAGQWNDYEIIAQGETVTLRLNGEIVNQATGCEPVAGSILLTSEGSPIQFRQLQIREGKPRPGRR